MRLVCISDIHGRTPKLPPGDILIVAGDLTVAGELDEISDIGDWLRSLPHTHKLVIAGNHDSAFDRTPDEARSALGPGIHYLQDEAISIRGHKFYGTPWSRCPDHLDRLKATKDWAFHADPEPWDKIPHDTDVLITHRPPYGVLDKVELNPDEEGYPGKGSVGSKALAEIVQRIQPRYHIFGHIHPGHGVIAPFGFSTTFINASYLQKYANQNGPTNRPWVVPL